MKLTYFLVLLVCVFNYSKTSGLEVITKLPSHYKQSVKKILRKFSTSFAHKKPVAGISFLEAPDKKIVLLHDQHDQIESLDTISHLHQQEITKLITRLKQRAARSSFYIEFPLQTKNFRITQDNSGIHIPIRDALKNNFLNGSIVYKSFDRRTEHDFWLREMFINPKELDSGIKTNTSIPREFYTVSLKNYLYDLEKKKKASQKLIAFLPALATCKNAQKINHITQMQLSIVSLAGHYNIPLDNNFFDLVKKMSSVPDQKNKLFLALLQIQSIETDLSLAHSLQTESEETSVIHAGAYHTHQLEEFLLHTKYQLKHHVKNGLNAQNLTNITWPTNYQTRFADHILEFIGNK